jgi:uncharacterized protein YggE
MNRARIALVGGAVALVVAVAAVAGVGRSHAASAATDEVNRTISVSGTGSVTVIPNRAHLSFGVETTGETATAALSANGGAMRKLIAAIRGAGIAPADIQTQQVSLSPTYSDDDQERIIGYGASNSVSVNVRKLADAGALIDKAVAAGANQVSGPSLDREDLSALYHKALEAAIADARAKAQVLAIGSNLTLGRVTYVSESTSEPPVSRDAFKAAASEAPSTPIEAGTSQLQATVSVTFEAT